MLKFSWTITQEVENFFFFNLKIKFFSPKKQGGGKSENSVGLRSFKFVFTFEMPGRLAGGLRSTWWSFLSGMFYSSLPSPAEAILATAFRESSPERVLWVWMEREGAVCVRACMWRKIQTQEEQRCSQPLRSNTSPWTHTCTHTHICKPSLLLSLGSKRAA